MGTLTLQDLDTPHLVVDVDVLDRNVQAVAKAVGASGLVVRPHAKTHKCLQIAQR